MRHSIILTVLIIFYLFFYYELVSSSADVKKEKRISRYLKLSKNKNDEMTDLRKIFFENFKTIYLESFVLRIVILIGGREENLYEAKAFFENCPVVVCKNLEGCPAYREWFSLGSLVVIFIEEMSKETFLTTEDILSEKWSSIIYITEGIIDERNIISSTFADNAIKKRVQRIKFAQFNNKLKLVNLYGHSIGRNCSIEVRLESVWKAGKSLDIFGGWFDHLNDFNGCPVTVSTCSFPPKMMTKKRVDGSEIVTGGSEGDLLLTLGEKLNFKLIIRSPAISEQMKYSRRSASINEVISGQADLAIGGLRATLGLSNLHISMEYDHDCTVWTVPREIEWRNNISWMVFPWQVWSLIGLAYVAICLFGYVYQKIDLPKKRNEKRVKFSSMILDIVALHFGNSIVNVPLFAEGRIILMLSLWFALIMTTAFKTSLASILTTNTDSQLITDAEGIVRENLSVGGTAYNLDFLNDQINESVTISKLVERFVVINNPFEVMRIRNLDENFAFLTRRSSIAHEIRKKIRSREPISYVTLNDCVLEYYTVMIFREDSQLLESINVIISRLLDSGIVNHWVSTQIESEKEIKYRLNNPGCFGSCITTKFIDIFVLYSGCVASSIFTFLIELIIISPKIKRIAIFN